MSTTTGPHLGDPIEFTERRDEGRTVTVRYVVTGSSGYRAELSACICEGRTPCSRAPDHSSDAAHVRTHCHAWHLPGRVERLAADVLKTYATSGDGQLDLFAQPERTAA